MTQSGPYTDPLRLPGTAPSYKWVSSVIIEVPTKKEEAWGVQFALPPGADHCRGGGAFWKDRDREKAGVAEQTEKRLQVGATSRRQALVGPREPLVDADGDVDMVVPVDADFRCTREGSAGVEVEWSNIYAACAHNLIHVYKANKGGKPTLLQKYEDPCDEETFFSLSWTFNVDGKNEWWLAVAGKRGVLRILNVSQCKLERTLIGHGESINHVTTHPRDPSLLLTASKDESLRLWNLRTVSTVAVFAGLRGHRGEVLYADFDCTGSKFASCGIDNSIRVWDITGDDKVVSAILETHRAADRGITDVCVYTDEMGGRRKAFVPMVQFPSFTTGKVHKHYVDCVHWVGDLLVSKSLQNRLLLWEPKGEREALASPASQFTVLEEYMLDACVSWFIRFGIDCSRQLVACGNERGVVTVYKLDDIPSKALSVLWAGQGTGSKKQPTDGGIVRQCAFNSDASILLAVDDSSRVVQYDRVEQR
jgi:polycomb protein EED